MCSTSQAGETAQADLEQGMRCYVAAMLGYEKLGQTQ